MALHDLDEGAWSVVVGGRTLTLRPFSASDMVAKEREQLELRATDEEWRRYMPLHQLHAVCEHLARIDRRREKANG